jgi:uncharacterized protein (DUF736 family)
VTDKQYNNELRGILFLNDRRTADNHPHLKGQCQIESIPYWASGWVMTPRSGGADFISFVLQRKDRPKDAPKPAKDDPNLRGAIFPNDRKDTAEKPDFTGRVQVDGVEWWINGWNKAPREPGDDFIALTFEKAVGGATRSTGRLDANAMLARAKSGTKPKSDAPRDDYDQMPPPNGGKEDFDDNIPFIWAFALPLTGLLIALLNVSAVVT